MEQIQLAILLSGSHKCVGAARSVQPSLLTSVCNFYFSSSPSSSCSSPPPPPLASPPALYARISPETTHARKRKVCWFGVCAFKLCILYKSFNGALLIRPFYPDSRPDFGIFLLAKWSRHFLYFATIITDSQSRSEKCLRCSFNFSLSIILMWFKSLTNPSYFLVRWFDLRNPKLI